MLSKLVMNHSSLKIADHIIPLRACGEGVSTALRSRRGRSSSPSHRLTVSFLLLLSLLLPACSSSPKAGLINAVQSGDYGLAREKLLERIANDKPNEDFILDRLRLTLVTLADGLPQAAGRPANQMFALLRTQGLNADKTVASVVLNEGVKTWKGEPFEQALAYYYIGIQKALNNDWDNARAAAQNSLFLLKDFGDNERGDRKSTEEIAREAAKRDDQKKNGGDQYLDKGYAAVETNFALGYVLNGIANAAIGRDDEARDSYAAAARIDPALEPLAQQLTSGAFNTILIVETGLGPQKVAYGSDNALARFAPRWTSDRRPLGVSVMGSAPQSFPVVCDVNTMAADHMWNNLEDVRQFKSLLGTGLLIGGAAVALSSDDSTTQIVGGAAALLGALMKGSAQADLRYCEILPQRMYIVPLTIDSPATRIDLGVDGDVATRLTLPVVDPPIANQRIRLHYIRPGAWRIPPAYATDGQFLYGNDAWPAPVPGDDLPYIMGGRDTHAPSLAALQRYQRAGHLADLSLVDLQNLYRAEKIQLEPEERRGYTNRHILEGGDSLLCPLNTSVGYLRLFMQQHAPYQPRSKDLKKYLDAAKTSGNAPAAEPSAPLTRSTSRRKRRVNFRTASVSDRSRCPTRPIRDRQGAGRVAHLTPVFPKEPPFLPHV